MEGARPALLLRRAGRLRGLDLARLALERILLDAAAESLPAFAIGLDGEVAQVRQLLRLADESAWLRAVLAAFDAGRRWPSPLFPRSASAYAQAAVRQKSALAAALEAWEGREDHPGEARRPLNALIARDDELPILTDRFAAHAQAIYVPLFAALVEVAA